MPSGHGKKKLGPIVLDHPLLHFHFSLSLLLSSVLCQCYYLLSYLLILYDTKESFVSTQLPIDINHDFYVSQVSLPSCLIYAN